MDINIHSGVTTMENLLLLIIVLMGIVFCVIIYFKSKENKRQIRQLKNQIKEERSKAQEQNSELLGMYEELEANDEEVRAQYQEILENRDHLKLIQKRNNLLFKASNEVIWELDLKTGVRHFAEENYVEELPLDLIQSIRFEDWAYDLYPDDQKPFADAMRSVLNGEKPFDAFEIRVNDLQGGWKWLRSKVVSLSDEDGETILMAGSYSDIDDRKQKEKRIHDLAYHDQLTGLENRLSLIEHVIEHLLTRREEVPCEGVFYYIDVDEFGAVNNTFGHDIGDLLIKEVSKRLLGQRPHDFIARIGGADFCVLTHEENLCESPEILATNLLELLREPYAIENKIIYLTASIGVAVYFEDMEGAESIIRHGDIALRRAKSLGKNRFSIYEKEMSDQISERLLMANELRTAIENSEMYMCFQPQIDLESNEIFGFESLLRWNSAVYGLVSPSRFIPLAEETGLIIGIGKWVFEQSCKFLKVISEIDSEIIVSVNAAAQQLEQASFIDEVREAMRQSGVRPEQICLEITESSVIKSLETAIYHLNQLKGEHVKIALDDFGTGFSSLNYLNQLPIDFLKIDRSFTSRITDSSKEYTLIKSIISLSHALNLKLILEGIEEKEQLVLIEEMGKAIIQGYYYAKPMVALDAIAYIHQYKQACIGIS